MHLAGSTHEKMLRCGVWGAAMGLDETPPGPAPGLLSPGPGTGDSSLQGLGEQSLQGLPCTEVASGPARV